MATSRPKAIVLELPRDRTVVQAVPGTNKLNVVVDGAEGPRLWYELSEQLGYVALSSPKPPSSQPE